MALSVVLLSFFLALEVMARLVIDFVEGSGILSCCVVYSCS